MIFNNRIDSKGDYTLIMMNCLFNNRYDCTKLGLSLSDFPYSVKTSRFLYDYLML